jgi:hypothetical protein
MHDAFGLGGCSGGEYDLEGCVFLYGFAYFEIRLSGRDGGHIGKCKRRSVWAEAAKQGWVADEELWGHFAQDSFYKLRGSGGIEGYGKDASKKTAEEDADPLGRVRSPERHTFARHDAALFQVGGKASGKLGEIVVGGTVSPDATMLHDCRLRCMSTEVLNETSEMRSHLYCGMLKEVVVDSLSGTALPLPAAWNCHENVISPGEEIFSRVIGGE